MKSKRKLIGLVVGVVAILLSALGFELSGAEDSAGLVSVITGICTLYGTFVTGNWGEHRAKATIAQAGGAPAAANATDAEPST